MERVKGRPYFQANRLNSKQALWGIKMKSITAILFFTLCFLLTTCSKVETPAYLNPALSMEKRVDDLVSRMTLEEKVSQMLNDAKAIPRLKIPR